MDREEALDRFNKLMEEEEDESAIPQEMYSTNGQKQSAELKLYLSGVLRDPYNHYCINCKKHKSTHVIIFIGALVCEKCAKALVDN